MTERSLQVTYRKGKAFSVYLHLSHQTGEKIARAVPSSVRRSLRSRFDEGASTVSILILVGGESPVGCTKEQTEHLSLPTQLKACEEDCEREAFKVLARFRVEGESAKTADRT